jgi:hypothetical protein
VVERCIETNAFALLVLMLQQVKGRQIQAANDKQINDPQSVWGYIIAFGRFLLQPHIDNSVV